MTHVRSGQPERARTLLEEALEIFAAFDLDPVTVNYTKFELAKLMWDEGERDGARGLIDEAETVFAHAENAGAPQLSDLRLWKRLVSY